MSVEFGGRCLTVDLLAISNHADMLGGGEYSFLDLVSSLKKVRRVVALTPGHGELYDQLRGRSVQTVVSTLAPIRPWLVSQMVSDLYRMVRFCRHHRVGLVYANGSRAAFYGGIASWIRGIPMVWHCRIADRDQRLDPVLLRVSSRIIANSQATASRFSTRFQPKVRVVYNGIRLSRFLSVDDVQAPSTTKDRRVIISVARISRQKRHDVTLSAFESIALSDSSLHLFLIGGKDRHDTDWWEFLRKRSKESVLRDRIHWVGHVDDVRPWYRAAELMIFPSEKESFGRVVVEAMASGVPVVAARSGGLPEIITHGEDGFLFSPGSADQLVDYVRILLAEAKTRHRIARAAQDRSRDFSLEQHVLQVSHVFDEII